MKRTIVPIVLVVAALAGLAAALGLFSGPPRPTAEGGLLLLDRDGLTYAFNTTFRVEQLFETAKDPYRTRDLAAQRPADVERLRAELLRALGKSSLDEIPNGSTDWIETLRKGNPGYVGREGKGR